MSRRPVVTAPWSSRCHGPGMEDGPGAVPDHVFEEMYAFIRRGLGAS